MKSFKQFLIEEETKPKLTGESGFGYPVREIRPNEDEFFKTRTDVAGMATDDNHIIVNPYHKAVNSNPQNREGLINLEGARLFLRNNNYTADDLPDLTPEQRGFLMKLPAPKGQKTPGYSDKEVDLRSTAISRFVGNDMAFPPPSEEQKAFVEKLRSGEAPIKKSERNLQNQRAEERYNRQNP